MKGLGPHSSLYVRHFAYSRNISPIVRIFIWKPVSIGIERMQMGSPPPFLIKAGSESAPSELECSLLHSLLGAICSRLSSHHSEILNTLPVIKASLSTPCPDMEKTHSGDIGSTPNSAFPDLLTFRGF